MGILKSIHQKDSGIFPYSFVQQEIIRACGHMPIVTPHTKPASYLNSLFEELPITQATLEDPELLSADSAFDENAIKRYGLLWRADRS